MLLPNDDDNDRKGKEYIYNRYRTNNKKETI